MRKSNIGLSIILSLVFVVMLALPCWAIIAPATQLHIVRASDGSLWKMTCDGSNCSAFTSFPGNFASQPSVTWDEAYRRYVVIGVASNGSIWRCHFNVSGGFQNDWVTIPGIAASPVGSASGDMFESHVWISSTEADTTIGQSCTNYSGGSVTVDAPASGSIVVEADVIVKISHTNGTEDSAVIIIGENAADCSGTVVNGAWIFIPSNDATSATYNSRHLTKRFIVSAGSKTFYLNGYMSSGQDSNDLFFYANMKAVYYPE